MNCIRCGSNEIIRYDDGNYKCMKCKQIWNDLVYRETVILAPKPTYKTKCIICDSEKEVSEGVLDIFVCDGCKDAIKRLKAMLGV